MLSRSFPLRILAALALSSIAIAQDAPTAFIGARLIPIDGPEIENGVLVIHEGKIVAIGGADLSFPGGAQRVDMAGKVIMPGLVDTHSHIGWPFAADDTSPIQPECRSLDSVNVMSSGFRRVLAGGLTTLNLMSGSGHLLSGQTVYVKLRGGKTIEEIAYRFADDTIMGGVKMANGTNSQRAAPFPGTRGKSAALVREMFVNAQEYQAKIDRAAGDAEKMPERDLAMETVLDILSGRKIVHHHTHRHDDIMTVLRLQREFGFRVVLHHVSEAWKVADEIAAAKAPCSIIVVDSPGGKIEALYVDFKTGGVLEKAGVNVAIHTDDWITDSRLFLRCGALCVRAGMSREAALRALTLAGAEMLDLQERVGSLTVGKDADLAILSGDPFSVYTRVEQTWVEGRRVFDREDPEDRLYAEGGFGAGSDVEPFLCCQHPEDHR